MGKCEHFGLVDKITLKKITRIIRSDFFLVLLLLFKRFTVLFSYYGQNKRV